PPKSARGRSSPTLKLSARCDGKREVSRTTSSAPRRASACRTSSTQESSTSLAVATATRSGMLALRGRGPLGPDAGQDLADGLVGEADEDGLLALDDGRGAVETGGV